jgi:hypothetical protein
LVVLIGFLIPIIVVIVVIIAFLVIAIFVIIANCLIAIVISVYLSVTVVNTNYRQQQGWFLAIVLFALIGSCSSKKAQNQRK